MIGYQKKADTRQLGLTDEQAEASRQAHGSNLLTQKKGKSFLRRFLSNLGDLESLVFFCKECRDMVVHRFDFSFVKAFYIFSDIFFVVFEKLLLNSECAAEILVVYECLDNFRHTSDCHIVTEEFEKFICLQGGKRFDFLHV